MRQPEDLQSTIESLRSKIRGFLERSDAVGEENTKAILIEPLLVALGWDVHELEEVKREYKKRPKDKPVDYALFLLRTPRLFLEAKALKQDLSDRRWVSQMLGYSAVAGAEWCVLTNGDEYRLYNAHAVVDADDKLFWVVRMSETGCEAEVAQKLSLLSKKNLDGNLLAAKWEAHFVDRRVRKAIEEMVAEKDRQIIRAIRKRVPELKPAKIEASLERVRLKVDYPVVELSPTNYSSENEQSEKTKRTREEKKPRRPRSLDPGKRSGVSLLDIINAGLIKPPMHIFTKYKSAFLDATILQDGRVEFAGTAYDSLSTAGGMARKSIIGAPKGRPYPQTNGWTFWKWRNPTSGHDEELADLRSRFVGK